MNKQLPKCPRCGSLPFRYRELNTVALDFNLENGKFTQTRFDEEMGWNEAGFDHPTEDVSIVWEMGEPEPIGKVEAECECGHIWTLRKFSRIDDLIQLHGYNDNNL